MNANRKVETLIVNAAELVTLDTYGGLVPLHGRKMREIGIIENGAVAIASGEILSYGKTHELLDKLEIDGDTRIIDAKGKTVTPGLIDSHTHPVFACTRENEFAMRIEGKSYMEIAKAGGGILNTARKTAELTLEEMSTRATPYLSWMLSHGITTIEGKSGYGLTTESELNMLQALRYLDQIERIDIIPTFMGAHEIPAEFRGGQEEEYVELIIEEMLPIVSERKLAQFCDIFCEVGVFDLAQTRRILTKAKELGLGIKLHADEIEPMGGTELGVELGAISVDHIIEVSEEGIKRLAKSSTVATLLPGTSLFLGKGKFAPARELIDSDAVVALATDFNPGSSPTTNLPLIMSLGCISMKMTPAEVITSVTLNAAFAVGAGEKAGSLTHGKNADIVIWNVDNHVQIPYFYGESLVETVIKKGRVAWEKK
jgi:imidazolonepropionase